MQSNHWTLRLRLVQRCAWALAETIALIWCSHHIRLMLCMFLVSQFMFCTRANGEASILSEQQDHIQRVVSERENEMNIGHLNKFDKLIKNVSPRRINSTSICSRINRTYESLGMIDRFSVFRQNMRSTKYYLFQLEIKQSVCCVWWFSYGCFRTVQLFKLNSQIKIILNINCFYWSYAEIKWVPQAFMGDFSYFIKRTSHSFIRS